MQNLQTLEVFEMETLSVLNSIRVLENLYFGGGTMLRLCHNLNRFSTDLDFWIEPEPDGGPLFRKIYKALSENFEITDAEEKHHMLLFEIRTQKSVRRLVIEIRKEQSRFDWEQKITFSKFSNYQIVVRGLTLDQMMQHKIRAALSRKLIRDCFDIEFLIKRGVKLPAEKDALQELVRILDGFRDRDFKVTLGSLLEQNDRSFYIENRFQILREEISQILYLAGK